MSMEIDGIEDLIAFNKTLLSEKKADLLLRDIALKTKRRAYELAPEDTGKMETMIQVHKIADGLYDVVCYIPYAIFNEFGTYKMPVGSTENPLGVTSMSGKRAYRPFMRPAVYQVMMDFPDAVKRILFGGEVVASESI